MFQEPLFEDPNLNLNLNPNTNTSPLALNPRLSTLNSQLLTLNS